MMISQSGAIFLIPTALLLAVSFFVLVLLRQVKEQALKAFGYLVAALLWLAALVVFSGGVSKVVSGGRYSLKCGKESMMWKKMHKMQMQQPGPQGTEKAQKGTPLQ
jgi:hypothetical protein